jgi:AcrR family transcriptional regulator
MLGAVINPTSLERALAAEPAPRSATPLDALRVARRHWLAGERLDMGALATELGVSRATLYRWVGSKEKLLGEVVWSLAAPMMEDARRRAKGGGAAYVRDVVERYMRAALAFEPLHEFLVQDGEYAIRVLCSKHSPMQRRSIHATQEMLAEQVEHGALDPPLELGSLAFVIVRIVESFLYSDIIAGQQPDVKAAGDTVSTLLQAPPPRKNG